MADKYTALVAEDSVLTQHALARALGAAGFDVVTADTRAGVLSRLLRERLDVLILSISLDREPVLDIVNQVRMSGAATGVILMVNSDRADGADLDADPDICVLGKPFALRDLIATARRLAERAQTRASAATGSGGHEASH